MIGLWREGVVVMRTVEKWPCDEIDVCGDFEWSWKETFSTILCASIEYFAVNTGYYWSLVVNCE